MMSISGGQELSSGIIQCAGHTPCPFVTPVHAREFSARLDEARRERPAAFRAPLAAQRHDAVVDDHVFGGIILGFVVLLERRVFGRPFGEVERGAVEFVVPDQLPAARQFARSGGKSSGRRAQKRNRRDEGGGRTRLKGAFLRHVIPAPDSLP
jgi:hypothetical protein